MSPLDPTRSFLPETAAPPVESAAAHSTSAAAPKDYLKELSEIDALIHTLFPSTVVREITTAPHPVEARSTRTPHGIKRPAPDSEEPARAEKKEKKEAEGKEKEEKESAASLHASEREVQRKLLLKKVSVLNDLPSLDTLDAKMKENVKKIIDIVINYKLPLHNKRILLERAKELYSTKQAAPYFDYAIDQKDAKMALELIEQGVSLTTRLSDLSLFEKMLQSNLELAETILKERPLAEDPTLIRHAVKLFSRYMEQQNLPIVEFLAKHLSATSSTQQKLLKEFEEYIRLGDIAKLTFWHEHPTIDLKLLRAAYGGRTYSTEEFLKDPFSAGTFNPLSLAAEHNQTELYPLFKGDDENIAQNLYAYLEKTLHEGNLAKLKKLPEVTERLLSIANNPKDIVQWTCDVTIKEPRNSGPSDCTFSLLSRTIFHVFDEAFPPYETDPKKVRKEKIEAIFNYIKFLVRSGADLNAYYDDDNKIYTMFFEAPCFSDPLLEEILNIALEIQPKSINTLYDFFLNIEGEINGSEIAKLRKNLFAKYCNWQQLFRFLILEGEDPENYSRERDQGSIQDDIKIIFKLYGKDPGWDLNAPQPLFENNPLLFFLLDHHETETALGILLELLQNRKKYRLNLSIEHPEKGRLIDYIRSKREELEKAHAGEEEPEVLEALIKLIDGLD